MTFPVLVQQKLLKHFRYSMTIIAMILIAMHVSAQNPVQNMGNRFKGMGGGGSSGGNDSLRHRTGLEDSLTITYRFLDTTRQSKMDSSINDFTKRFPIPAHYMTLGNNGSAAKSLLFAPNMNDGWDPGFHAYDIYRFTIEDTRFYTTTKPYSELGYLLGSKKEQIIGFTHTQNIRPNWNAGFQFRLINSPGWFKNQNTNHSNIRFNTAYTSKNKRYHLQFIALSNKLQGSENGGIQNEADLQNTVTYKDRVTIPVQLGNYIAPGFAVFNSKISTGTKDKNSAILLRQQYDFGQKDSTVTDSTVIHLFYPRLRVEYTLQYNKFDYAFVDQSPDNYYVDKYDFFAPPPTNFVVEEKWTQLVNDFSFYTFPDSHNSQQYLKLGASIENLKGTFTANGKQLYNTILHGEYRNKTRNKKWDFEAAGNLYPTGYNAGDFSVYGHLQRYLGKKFGTLLVGTQITNRTPSYIYTGEGSFGFTKNSFNKENILKFFGNVDVPFLKMKLSGAYFLATNFTYFNGYYHPEQASSPFNLLQVSADKDFKLTRHLIWHAQVALQQRIGDGPVNVPLFYTRNRIGYEGNLGFKNLVLNTGLEIKYNSPFKADGYSPMFGQFYFQDDRVVSLKAPEVDAYLHFRIRSFVSYVRLENLNSISFKNGFTFTNNNLATANYPYPGVQLRVGIYWTFVN